MTLQLPWLDYGNLPQFPCPDPSMTGCLCGLIASVLRIRSNPSPRIRLSLLVIFQGFVLPCDFGYITLNSLLKYIKAFLYDLNLFLEMIFHVNLAINKIVNPKFARLLYFHTDSATSLLSWPVTHTCPLLMIWVFVYCNLFFDLFCHKWF